MNKTMGLAGQAFVGLGLSLLGALAINSRFPRLAKAD